MKKPLVVSGLLLVMILTGCGKLATEMQIQNLSNQGEVQGKVYDSAASNYYASRYVPIAGAKVYVGNFEATTAADGSYKLSGIPAGLITVTATADGYTPQSIKVDRNTVNFYLEGGSSTSESGSATISGTIYGLPAGATSVYGHASSLRKSSFSFSYNSSLYKYTLTNAPDDGETYLFANYSSYEAEAYSGNIYTYTKLDMSSGTKEANLDFGASTNSLTINIALPAGYRNPSLGVSIYDGFWPAGNIYSRILTEEGALLVPSLPQLQSGDSYAVALTARGSITGEGTYKALVKYNAENGSTVNMDLTTVPKVSLSSPANGVSLNSNPTFVWEPIGDNRVVYLIYLVSGSPSQAVWSGLTKENSITLPDMISLSDGNYQWGVTAIYYTNLDVAELGPTSSQSYLNWISTSDVRNFSYAKL